jgi:hypothetical protein
MARPEAEEQIANGGKRATPLRNCGIVQCSSGEPRLCDYLKRVDEADVLQTALPPWITLEMSTPVVGWAAQT